MLSHTTKAEGILAKVTHPSKGETAAISALLPVSIHGRVPSGKCSFDHTTDSRAVVLLQQKKKIAAIQSKLERFANVTVVIMDKYLPVVPKGKFRQLLARKGKIHSISLRRSMLQKEDKVSL